MRLLLGILVLTPLVVLVVGTIRGRVRLSSCCAVPAARDGRMASAYDDTVAGRLGFASQHRIEGTRTSVRA